MDPVWWFWIDNVLEINQALGSGTKTADSFNVGYYTGLSFYLNAKIGELQTYTSALTETQILQNYNATKYKYFYGLNGWHLNFDNSDEGSIVSGSDLKLFRIRP